MKTLLTAAAIALAAGAASAEHNPEGYFAQRIIEFVPSEVASTVNNDLYVYVIACDSFYYAMDWAKLDSCWDNWVIATRYEANEFHGHSVQFPVWTPVPANVSTIRYGQLPQ